VSGRAASVRWRAAVLVAIAVATRPNVRIGAWSASALVMPAADTSTSRFTRSGNWIATSAVTKPPIELPTSSTAPTPISSQNAFTQRP
jgi:hypothetical protein